MRLAAVLEPTGLTTRLSELSFPTGSDAVSSSRRAFAFVLRVRTRSTSGTAAVLAVPNLLASSVPPAVTRSMYETGFPSTLSWSASASLIE
jgi:hypothetical protein